MQFIALEKCNNCASNCNSKLQLQKLVTVRSHCAPNSLGALRQAPNSLGGFMPQAPNSLRCIMHLSTELAFLPDAWLVTTLSVQTQNYLWFGLLCSSTVNRQSQATETVIAPKQPHIITQSRRAPSRVSLLVLCFALTDSPGAQRVNKRLCFKGIPKRLLYARAELCSCP